MCSLSIRSSNRIRYLYRLQEMPSCHRIPFLIPSRAAYGSQLEISAGAGSGCGQGLIHSMLVFRASRSMRPTEVVFSGSRWVGSIHLHPPTNFQLPLLLLPPVTHPLQEGGRTRRNWTGPYRSYLTSVIGDHTVCAFLSAKCTVQKCLIFQNTFPMIGSSIINCKF